VADLSVGGLPMVKEAVERALDWSDGVRSARRGPLTAGGWEEGIVVSVFSSKGGTGKTFLAANLAAAVAQVSGKETAILDLDLERGDVFSYFGEETSLSPNELMALADLPDPADVLAAGTPLEPSLWGYAARSEPGGGTAITAEATGSLIRALRRTAAYTIVDSSASYSDHALSALELSDRILLITTLDVTGVRHLSLAMDTLQTLGLDRERLKFVLNRADSKVDLSPADVQEIMKLRVDARIPSSPMVPISLNKGRPITVDSPGAAVSKAIRLLAEMVVALPHSAALAGTS
jgi:pilus assembly protein CpaE